MIKTGIYTEVRFELNNGFFYFNKDKIYSKSFTYLPYSKKCHSYKGNYVYIFYGDKHGEVIYVGCTKNLLKRLTMHRISSDFFSLVKKIRIKEFLAFEECLKVERKLLMLYRPAYNSLIPRIPVEKELKVMCHAV